MLNKIVRLLPFFLLFTLITWLVSGNIFFWDTIQLGSLHANYFYENNFVDFLLPDKIDSGHIPAFGAYLAIIWKIFGKTLFVSHFAILPFIYGIIWQGYNLIEQFISKKYVIPALILFLADATLLAQFTLVSPDVPLVFLFLLALNSVLKKRKVLLSISITGLFLISMRGMMVASSILILDIIFNVEIKAIRKTAVQLFKKAIIYLPALIVFISYNFYHYSMKDWIGYHKDSPWASNFEITNFMGFIRNIGILIWRLIDFGRIFIWLTAIIILIPNIKGIFNDLNIRKISLIFIVTALGLSVSFLLYKSLTGHRYILPLYLIFSLLTSYFIFEKLHNIKFKYIVFSILLIGMLSGNFWIYPEKIAQGWDATLSHQHYYNLRLKMLDYMKERKIKVTETGSAFPNISEYKYLDLSESTKSFKPKNLEKDKYIFYSNVFNNFSDFEIEKLKQDFKLVKKNTSFGVFVSLYEKKTK